MIIFEEQERTTRIKLKDIIGEIKSKYTSFSSISYNFIFVNNSGFETHKNAKLLPYR